MFNHSSNDKQTFSTVSEIESHLSRFRGTTEYHRLSNVLPNIALTDGTLEALKILSCGWLFVQIGILQKHHKIIADRELSERIQFWRLETDLETNRATLCCDRDKDDTALATKIPYTDMPLPLFRVWVQPLCLENFKGHVIHLPSEY